MTSDPKRILILTADAGFGHRSAANAITAALEELYQESCQIDVVNPYDDRRVPFFLRDTQNDYDTMVREMPDLYRFGYDASDATVPHAIMESALTVLLYEVMSDLLQSYHPDAILTTYPVYQAPLVSIFAVRRSYTPLITVVTDLVSVHRIWFNKNVDTCLVPTQYARDLALAYGLAESKVQITGIPVHPDIVRKKHTKAEIRRQLGWDPDMLTILAVGSRRVERLTDTLRVLNHFGQPIQFIVVAGKDEELYRQAQAIDWHVPHFIYDYVTNIPDLMHASDAIICKAGGLILTESLACGLPIMLVDILPGQEIGNAEYVVNGGAADLAETPTDALEVLYHWIMDGASLLNERARNSARLGRPSAAYRVAEFAWKAAERGPLNRRGKRIAGRPGLVELLTRNKVPLKERPHHKHPDEQAIH
jgi:1,2-diacylglycerol 3-beta-galactosyltransferase